jgi:hypothetical protein
MQHEIADRFSQSFDGASDICVLSLAKHIIQDLHPAIRSCQAREHTSPYSPVWAARW